MASLDLPQNEKEIILNTPNRREILQQGPPQQTKNNLLGKGAFGTVYKASYNGKEVAVKIVKNDQQFNTLLNESNIVGWNHRNIVNIIKIESASQFGMIIMERFPGYCLQAVLDSKVELDLTHRVYISLDILAALHYCHKKQLLHLDIKPQNVLVVTGGEQSLTKKSKLQAARREYMCKLCDFGSSQQYGANKENAAKRSTRGTVRYMSPEALREQPLTPAADIYSLGITMWQLQHKEVPYYWLECNQIVAYQVVKNHLRPDANAKSKLKLSTQKIQTMRHDNCYCSSFSKAHNMQTYQSVEQLKNLLKTVDFHRADQIKRIELPAGSGDSAKPKRKPFQLLSNSNSRNINSNNTTNAKRHLAFEKHASPKLEDSKMKPIIRVTKPASSTEDDIITHAHKMSTTSCSSSYDDLFIMQLFSSNHKSNPSKLASFESIYKSCWHHDIHLRPHYTELRMLLGNLL